MCFPNQANYPKPLAVLNQAITGFTTSDAVFKRGRHQACHPESIRKN